MNEIPHTYIEIFDHPANWPMTPIFQRSAEILKKFNQNGWVLILDSLSFYKKD